MNIRMTLIMVLLMVLLSACASESKQADGIPKEINKVADINTKLASAYYQKGLVDDALVKASKALAADDQYAPAHTVMALIQEQKGNTEIAGTHYEKAARYAAGDGGAQNNYGAFLCRNEEADKADAYFRRALGNPQYPTPQVALANAGACAHSVGKDIKAEEYLRQSLDYPEHSANALILLAEIYYDREDFLKARGFLQRYESVGPNTDRSLLLGYRVETGLGDKKLANQYRDELQERYPEFDIEKRLALPE